MFVCSSYGKLFGGMSGGLALVPTLWAATPIHGGFVKDAMRWEFLAFKGGF